MNDLPYKQTAYENNAHSNSKQKEKNKHGWSNEINRMIDQRYAFLALQYENTGYLFRGMGSGLFNVLLENKFWHYSISDNQESIEQELNILLLTQDFSDALTVSRLWKNNMDTFIVIFKSEVFNQALKEKKPR